MLRLVRQLYTLGAQPHVAPYGVAGQLGQPRHLRAQPLVVLVQPPQERRQPGGASFQKDEAQRGEQPEDAFTYAFILDQVGLAK